MDKLLNMCINFGFASFRSSGAEPDAYQKIGSLMQEFLSYAQSFNHKTYGFSGAPIQCSIFSGDLFTTDAIGSLAREQGYRYNLVTSALSGSDDTPGDADSVIALDIRKSSLSYASMLAEYVVNKSDALFLLWDGSQELQDGILWTVLQLCKQKRIPYYLINTRQLDDVSFSPDSYYVPYTPQRVKAYVAKLYDYPEEPHQDPRPIPLSRLWLAMHNRFIRKYKLMAKNIPYVEDKLLSKDYFPQDHAAYANHAMLTEYFSYYDSKAVEASSMYRASIYFRSILPMLATVFITVGFYAETVLTFFLGNPMVLGMSLWTILAGLGFLVHALLNIYAGETSKNPQVKRLQKDFIEARFVAEYLRVVIHSEAYGIQIDALTMDDTLVEPHVLAKVHHIIRQQQPLSHVQSAQVMEEAIQNLEALIGDQIAYHENCINRYSLITQRLKKMSTAMYGIGVTTVILRGIFQFLIPFLSGVLQVRSHDVTVYKFSTSFANMLALVLPAWASYLSSKLNMNNYEWLLKNSEKARDRFMLIQQKLNTTKLRGNNSYQMVDEAANDIMAIARDDHIGWYLRTESQTFTRI